MVQVETGGAIHHGPHLPAPPSYCETSVDCLQVPLTCQPGRTTGLERQGFYGVHGPGYEPDRLLYHRAADVREWTTYEWILRLLIHMNGYQGPAPLEHTAGVSLRAVHLGTGFGRPEPTYC